MEEKFKSQKVLWSQSSAHSSPDCDETPGTNPARAHSPSPMAAGGAPRALKTNSAHQQCQRSPGNNLNSH